MSYPLYDKIDKGLGSEFVTNNPTCTLAELFSKRFSTSTDKPNSPIMRICANRGVWEGQSVNNHFIIN